MKKLTFILALAAFASFSSCSKEKDCVCTTTVTFDGQDPVTTTADVHITEGKCSDGDSSTDSAAGKTTVSCKEK